MRTPVNLGPRGIRRRIALGVLALVAAGLLLVALTVRGAPVVWTLACAVFFWLGGLGILQARAKT